MYEYDTYDGMANRFYEKFISESEIQDWDEEELKGLIRSGMKASRAFDLAYLVNVLVETDPDSIVADGGVTAFDAWEQSARRVLGTLNPSSYVEEIGMLDPFRLMESNCWDVRCISEPIEDTGDAETVWVVIEHYMSKPYEREIARGGSPKEALTIAKNRLASKVKALQGSGDER